ncbi:MAG: hypothetical protein WCP18_00940 [bacterium]
MTRGIAVLLHNDNLVRSLEFNGHMYCDYDSNGYQLIELLKGVNDLKSFDFAIKSFNDEFFGYSDVSLYRSPLPTSICFDNRSYIGKWFSDYVFIRNALGRPFMISDINGDSLSLPSKSTAVYYFGSFYTLINDWEPCFCLPNKLKQNLNNNYATV